MQIQFLPYHSLHHLDAAHRARSSICPRRVAVARDLSGRETEAGSGWTTWARRAAWTGAVLALGVFALAFSIAAAVAVVVAWLLCVRYVFNRKGRAPGVFLARVADACAFDAPKGAVWAAKRRQRSGGSWVWSGLGFALSAMAILFSFGPRPFPANGTRSGSTVAIRSGGGPWCGHNRTQGRLDKGSLADLGRDVPGLPAAASGIGARGSRSP